MSKSPISLSPATNFDAMVGSYERLATEAHFTLQTAVEASGIKTHTISSRVKDKASYLEKIIRKGYEDPLNEVEDLVGVRVVCLFTADLPRLRAIVYEAFEVVSEDDKVEGGPADSFGYMSVHYICRLHPNNAGPRYRGLENIKFEVQCRTILMDAWANVSHYLAYKGEASIPEPLKKDFHALAGLFYVADKHFELFFKDSEGSQVSAAETVAAADRLEEVPINRDTLQALLVSKYPDRSGNNLEAVSDLVQVVSRAGYKLLSEVERDLDRASVAALEFEREHPPFGQKGRRYLEVGLARQALSIANETFARASYGSWQPGRFTKYRRLLLED